MWCGGVDDRDLRLRLKVGCMALGSDAKLELERELKLEIRLVRALWVAILAIDLLISHAEPDGYKKRASSQQGGR